MSDNNITLLLKALVSPAQDIENAFQQLLTDRTIDTATGVNLDVIGRIVGQARGGLDDTTYRRYCKARVKVHRSHGLPEELIAIAKLIIGTTDDGHVWIHTVDDATFILEIKDVTVDPAVAAVLQAMLVKATGGGVRVIVVYSAVTYANTMRCDGGPVLDAVGSQIARGVDYASTI